jgi:hypothetical protein
MRTAFPAQILMLCLASPLVVAAPLPTPSPSAYSPGTRLVEGGPGLFESYGLGLAASGDTLLVGAPGAFPDELVDIYVRNGPSWKLQATLNSPDGSSGDFFGESVAIQGDLVAVGAPDHLSASGAVYVFSRAAGEWTFLAKLRAADAGSSARFGESISIDGNTMAIGAFGANQRRGAVYVFVNSGSGWVEQQRLTAADALANDNFGAALSLSNERLLVGAPLKDGPTSDAGAAYVFTRTGTSWSQQTKLQRPGALASERFGTAVALDGDIAAIGATDVSVEGVSGAGAALVFTRGGQTWALQATLHSSEVSAGEQFGGAIALVGERLLVGAGYDTVNGIALQGSAEVFLRENGSWVMKQRLLASEPGNEDQLGYGVALSGNFAAASAPGTTVGGQAYAGAVHAFISLATNTSIAPVMGQPVRIGDSYNVRVSVTQPEVPPTGSVEVIDDLGQTCNITLNAGGGSCSLSASSVGPRALTARYNGAPGIAESSATATVQVRPDLRISPASLPDGQIGAVYAQLFDSAATGATLPLSYSLASGSLPLGLMLGSNGSLSGTASSFGSFSFSVRLTDSSPANLGGPFSETRAYTLTIQPPFRTSLLLMNDTTSADRGQSVAYTSLLDVVEAGAAAPAGNYVVTATRGAQVLSCSATVTAQGAQSCSITFPLAAPVGDYGIAAQFISTNADYGNSGDSGTHQLFAPADPAVQVQALDSTYQAGQTVRFRIDISNSGSDSAFALQLQTNLDAALTNLVWTCSGSACPAPGGSGMPNVLINELATGAQLSLQVSGVVGASAPASLTLSAQLNLQPEGFSRELDPGNNSASAGSLPVRLFADGFEDPEN